jgi:hypothetical protein
LGIVGIIVEKGLDELKENNQEEENTKKPFDMISNW